MTWYMPVRTCTSPVRILNMNAMDVGKRKFSVQTSVLRTFKNCSHTTPPHTTHHKPLITHHSSYTNHHTPLIIHHSSHTTHLTPLITHHSSHATHLTPITHHSSHTTHLTPLILHHSSHTTHLTPLITHHSTHITHRTPLILHHSSHTTRHTPLISFTSSSIFLSFCNKRISTLQVLIASPTCRFLSQRIVFIRRQNPQHKK